MSTTAETPTSSAKPRVPGGVYLLALISFASSLGFGMIGPALPSIASMYRIDDAAASLAISGFALFRMCTNLSMSALLRRWRLRNVLIFGLVVQALCSIAAGMSPNFDFFLAFRALSGMGSAAFSISSTALLLLFTTQEQRARAMSVYFTAASLGTISGPALGGFAAGKDPLLPLIFYGVLLGFGALIAAFALRWARDFKTPDAEPLPDAPRRRDLLKELLRDPRYVAALLAQLATGWVLYGMRTSLLPLHLGSIGMSSETIGILLTVAALAQIGTSSTIGAIGARASIKMMAVIALTSGALAMLTFGVATAFWVIAAALAVVGITQGLLSIASPAMLGQVPEGASGLAVALYWATWDCGGIIGPWVAGELSDSVGDLWAFAVGALVMLVGLGATLRVRSLRASAASPVPAASPAPASPVSAASAASPASASGDADASRLVGCAHNSPTPDEA